MQTVSPLELEVVSGGLGFAFFSPVSITAVNQTAVSAPQLNVNLVGAAAQGGSVVVTQGIGISL